VQSASSFLLAGPAAFVLSVHPERTANVCAVALLFFALASVAAASLCRARYAFGLFWLLCVAIASLLHQSPRIAVWPLRQ